MADRRRIITLSPGGRPILDIDLETAPTYQAIADTFDYQPGQANTQTSREPGRYGGALTVGEQADNGVVSWKALVQGATPDLAAANIEALLASGSRTSRERLLEWRPDGVTYSSYFRVAGPIAWKSTYKWAQFAGVPSMVVDVSVPVRPLVLWDRMTITDPFDVDSRSDYTFDAATSADVAIGSGVMSPVVGAALSAERRARHTIRGYQLLEGQATRKYTPGSTITSFKGGVTLRGSAPDSYVDVYVDDNGTNSRLRIDVVIAGVRTNRASVNLGSRISNGTAFWVRGRIENGVVFAEHFTSAPTPTGTPTTVSPAGGAGYTLVGGDAPLNTTAGYAGWSWVPQHASATADDFALQPYTRRNQDLPQLVSWADAIPGQAPALVDMGISNASGASYSAAFALIAWARRSGSPAGGYVSPFAILEGEAATTLVNWASSAQAGARGGNDVRATLSSSPNFASATWKIDASPLEADDFADSTIDMEIFARVLIASTITAGIDVVASVIPDTVASLDEGAVVAYSHEFGSAGAHVPAPSSGTKYYLVRLGVITIDQTSKLKLRIQANNPALQTGVVGLDYALMVPAMRRAASPTAIDGLSGGYPYFGAGVDPVTKTIRTDLSGRITDSAGNTFRHRGLGGSLITLTPGANDTLVKLSESIPNDPSHVLDETAISYTATVSMDVTPRSNMLRG
jgi:hypothetical protein